MIKAAIDKIQALTLETTGEHRINLKNGRNIYFYNGVKVASDSERRPDALKLHTLTALVGLIREIMLNEATTAELRYPPHTIIVDSQNHVTLYAPIQDIDYDRPVLATVEPLSAFEFAFNKFMSAEQFIIGLQACFVHDAFSEAVIDAVAGIKSDDSVSLKDDGVCQMATQKRGMQLEKQVALPNPTTLMPYRTFAEIEQPRSQFILRATDKRGEPEIGLFEADGGAWKNEAATRIRQYLSAELADLQVQILG